MSLNRMLRMLGTATLAVGFADAAFAQGFSIESAVLDSRSAKNLGVTTEQGQMADFFKAQKAVTFGILRAAGISLDQLPPEVRARIERFQTTNLDAFRAFSEGLDLKDQGRFAEAKELFRRAAELDPGFGLAVEQQQAMPEVNVGSAVQMRAVVAAASNSAVDRGRQGYAVDLAHALAALQAGQTVGLSTTPLADPLQPLEYTVNKPGSGDGYAQSLVAGLSYSYVPAGSTGPLAIAVTNAWPGGKYSTSGGVLESVSSDGLSAQRGGAAIGNGGTPGSTLLADGVTTAYWGTWLSSGSNSATLTVQGTPYTATSGGLGNIDYVIAQATRQMPGTGTADFLPMANAGSLGQTSGTIRVDFQNRVVDLLNLGFNINGLSFSGLNGSSSYAPSSASGAFSGNYSQGSCTGCAAFTPQSSVFTGNFVGRSADGLVFSTIMLTGNGTGTASGVQLFKKP
jgi:hypothetical protein